MSSTFQEICPTGEVYISISVFIKQLKVPNHKAPSHLDMQMKQDFPDKKQHKSTTWKIEKPCRFPFLTTVVIVMAKDHINLTEGQLIN